MIHYITSYNSKLYAATGKWLERSYSEHQAKFGSPSLLLAYSEDEAGTRRINKEYLNWYLTTFNHLIPPHLGGAAKMCKCPSTFPKGGTSVNKINHKPGCHSSLWNRNAYRWFHKVAALKTYIDNLHSGNTPEYLVWLDCDCYFKKHLPNQFITDLCADYELCYLKGTKREAIESGILIFKMHDNSGCDIIQCWFNWYRLEWFIKEPRWDDGYILTQVVKKAGYDVRDLVSRKAISRPADDCPLTPYLGHNKGDHVRKHQLF